MKLLLVRLAAHDQEFPRLLFLTLLERELRRESERFGRFLPLRNRVRRYCGDLANGGTGEILVRA